MLLKLSDNTKINLNHLSEIIDYGRYIKIVMVNTVYYEIQKNDENKGMLSTLMTWINENTL